MCLASAADDALTGHKIERRRFLGMTAAGLGAAGFNIFEPAPSAHAVELPPDSDASGTTLVLLGSSGGPVPSRGRHGIASIVSVNGTVYAVDCGLGMSQRMVQAGFSMAQLDKLFITHLHSDHFVDYLNIIQMTQTGIGHAIDVFGPDRPAGSTSSQLSSAPTSIEDVTRALVSADRYELTTRPGREQVSVHVIPNSTQEVSSATPFTVIEDDNVRVSAISVDHAPMPSYAFRFDTDHGSIAFSGDTAPTTNVVRLAHGADVLVHETFDRDAMQRQSPEIAAAFEAVHTPSSEVGSIAEQAQVPLLLLSHLIPGDPRVVSDAQWRNEAQTGYDGQVVVGHDLTRVRLRRGGDARVYPRPRRS